MIADFLDMGTRSVPELVSEYWVRRKRVLDTNRLRCRAKAGDNTMVEPHQRARAALQVVETELIKRGLYKHGLIVR